MFMKTFEEKWTAWLDGQLTGKELAEFEASLPDLTAAEAEKEQARKLGALLHRELAALPMQNADFFNHQVRSQIAASEPEERTTAIPELRPSWWSIRRLLWTGTASLAVFAVCTWFVWRGEPQADQSHYLSKILTARVDPALSPNATVSIFEANDEKVTVLWVEGLQALPSEYAAK